MDEDDEQYCEAIAETLSDYCVGAVDMGPEHVARWAKQFDPDKRELVLRETRGVLGEWYVSRDVFRGFIEDLARDTKGLGGEDPATFWREANILRLQKDRSSQMDMLDVFDEALQAKHGFGLDECGSDDGVYIYIDDGVFSGGTVKRDLRDWIQDADIADARVLVVVAGAHQSGIYHVKTALSDLLKERSIKLRWLGEHAIEDRKTYIDTSEVLRPRRSEGDGDVDAFVALLEQKLHPPVWRMGSGQFVPKGFSSDQSRSDYEHVMLRVGARLRASCADPDDAIKPLGYTRLWTLGFGSLLVTFRNCPNNAPLAWWWGDPEAEDNNPLSKWYPLLPRRRPPPPDYRKLFARLGGQ